MKTNKMDFDNKNKSQHESEEEKALDILLKEAERRKLKLKWEKKLVRSPDQYDTNPIKGKNLVLKIVTFIAISLLLGLSLMYLWPDKEDLQATTYAMAMATKTYFDNDLSSRGINDLEITKSTEIHGTIQDASQSGDLDLVIRTFEKLEKIKVLTLNEQFQYAVHLVKSKKGDKFKAKNILEKVLESNTALHQDALWYYALLQIQLADLSNAKLTLAEIWKSEYKKNEAKILLDIINKHKTN